MATYLIKRKFYAAVRNPYLERFENKDITEEVNEMDEEYDSTPELNKQVDKMKKSPIYQNLDKDKNIKDSVNKAISKINKERINKNQNININKTTNINNPAKEKSAELDAQVKMSKMRQQSAAGGGVNAKLIEIQKTNPLKPISMNGG